MVARAWSTGDGAVALRAEAIDPALIEHRCPPHCGPRPADRPELEAAIDRMRFALSLDDDLSDFYRASAPIPCSAR